MAERIPLLEKKSKRGRQDSEIEPDTTTPSFKELFVSATRSDFVLLGLATSIGIVAAPLFPLIVLSTQLSFSGAAPYEQITRQLTDGAESQENQTVLVQTGDDYISTVLLSLLLVASFALLQMLLKFLSMFIFGMVAVRMTRSLRYKYVSHVLGMDIGASQKKTTGGLIAMLDENIIKISDALEINLPQMNEIAVHLLAKLVMVLGIRWDIGLVSLSFILPAGLLFYLGTKSYIRMVGREQECFAKAAQIANECLMYIKTVICFNGQQHTITRYNKAVSEAMQVSQKRIKRITLIDAAEILITDAMCVTVLVYGASMLGKTEPFLLVTILMLSKSTSEKIALFNMHINAVFVAVGCAHQINKILAITPEIEQSGVGEKPEKMGSEIKFQNVSFCYPSRTEINVIEDLNLEINAGQKIAIVGQSGCGKSTIVALLMRFFDPTAGVITIDGKPTTSLNIKWLRSQIGLVSQEPVLFNMSIYDNLQCCCPTATHQEIVEALQHANAFDFVTGMTYGLGTYVGERGTQLSGGQKQRVAIARALLRKPAVLIFDEATSSLDSENEFLVQAAIDNVSQSYTTITIAHRLSTVLNADQLIVMDQGLIKESGTPEELFTKGQLFYGMLQQQNSIHSENHVKHSVTEKTAQKESSAPSNTMDNEPKEQTSENDHTDDCNQNRSPSVRSLITLHPEWKRSLVTSLVAALARSTRNITFLIMLSMSFEALTYEQDVMVQRVYSIACIYCLVVMGGFLSELILVRCVGSYADQLSAKLRTEILTHFLKQNLTYFDQSSHDSGTLSAGIATHPANIRETLAGKFPEFLTAVFMCLEAAAVALAFNARLFMGAASLSTLISLLRAIESRALLKEQKKALSYQSDAASRASEAFTNLETVKAYCLEPYFVDHYIQSCEKVEKHKIRGVFVNALLIGSSSASGPVAASLTWLIAAHMNVTNQNAPLLDLYVCLWMSEYAFSNLLSILTQARMIARALTSCNAIADILGEHTQLDNLTDTGLKPAIEGKTQFQMVSFGYPTRAGQMLFTDLELQVDKNKTLALVGPSGSGKSSILQLLLRLYDCNAGKIDLDGTNIVDLNPRHLRNGIVVVSQEPILFTGNIWENITYGIDDEQFTYEQVAAAALDANIHNFIISLPEGYATDVGQLGAKLSGGQKQRIAIARALIRKPKVLLLDEATASLDSASEALVQTALGKVQHGCTCVVVAHRLSTIKNCDIIMVLVDGKIVEKGAHNDLMEKQGLYYKMCTRQNRIQ